MSTAFSRGYAEAITDVVQAWEDGGPARALEWCLDNAPGTARLAAAALRGGLDQPTTRAAQLTPGDLFRFLNDATVWLVIETSAYSDGACIIQANGPTPDLTAVFTCPPDTPVVLA